MYTELRRLGSQSEGLGEMSGLHGAFANGTQSIVAFLQSGYVSPTFFKEGVVYCDLGVVVTRKCLLCIRRLLLYNNR